MGPTNSMYPNLQLVQCNDINNCSSQNTWYSNYSYDRNKCFVKVWYEDVSSLLMADNGIMTLHIFWNGSHAIPQQRDIVFIKQIQQ